MSGFSLTIRKPRLRQGRSYALKTSVLTQALAEAAVACPVQVEYGEPQALGSVLWAEYWLPNQHVPHPRIYIRVGAVPSEERHEAAAQLSAHGLPAFIRWTRTVLGLADGSPLLHDRPRFEARFEHGSLRISA